MFIPRSSAPRARPSFPTRRSSDLAARGGWLAGASAKQKKEGQRNPLPLRLRCFVFCPAPRRWVPWPRSWETIRRASRSEEHTSELQSQSNLVCRLLLEKKNNLIDG